MMLRQLFFFFPRKAFGFFQILWNWFHSLPMLRIVLRRGRRRLRRQAWVLAESSRTRRSHESTGTDYSLRRPHPLTPTRPGPIALEYFPAWPASHPKSTSPRTNEKRHNLVFDDTIRQDGPPGFDLCRDVQFWPSEQIRYPFPQGLEPFRASHVILLPPFHSTRRPLPRRPILNEIHIFGPGSITTLIDIISQQPEISALPHSFNSLLLKGF